MIGVDGCRAGWIAAIARRDRTELRLFPRLRDLPPGLVCVDIPIGLPAIAGLRACDRAARERLGPRAASVFPPPARWMLRVKSYAALRRDARRRGEPAISVQCWNLIPKIREAARRKGLLECHPEVAFAVLAGKPLPSKKKAEGIAIRKRLLRARFPDLDANLAAMPWTRSEVAIDDALDAYACLAVALSEPVFLGDEATIATLATPRTARRGRVYGNGKRERGR